MTNYFYENWPEWEDSSDQEIVEILLEKHPEMFNYECHENDNDDNLSWDDWMEQYTAKKNEEDIIMGHLIDIGES